MDEEDQAVPAGSASPAAAERVRLGYRPQVQGKRERRGALRYTDMEWALIITVAVRHRMKPGAWAQQAALDAAAAELRGTPGRREVTELTDALREHRNALARVGGNLNQLTAFANTTGQIPEAAAGILRAVRDQVHEADRLLALGHRVLAPTNHR